MEKKAETTHEEVARSPRRAEYLARVNRVIDHIERHLDQDLTVAELARIACFSPFHFHRVFGAVMGESLHQFVQRLRLERAARLLVGEREAPITHVALECGFSSAATFARAFSSMFGMNASEWRKGGHARYRAQGRHGRAVTASRNLAAQFGVLSERFDPEHRVFQWRIRFMDREPVRVEVEDVPTLHVAYVRHVGEYQGMAEVFARLFGRIVKWAGPRGLLRDREARLLAVYHDDPEITAGHKLRVSAGITVPAGTPVGGDVGIMTMPGGPCAIGHFRLGSRDYGAAWHALMAGWLPDSGYQPDDRLCCERYEVSGGNSGDGCPVDICVPVRPL
jgi:AraC family transcriptional regulator